MLTLKRLIAQYLLSRRHRRDVQDFGRWIDERHARCRAAGFVA